MTPLLITIEQEYDTAVRMLVEKGAAVNRADGQQSKPTFYKVSWSNSLGQSCHTILDHGITQFGFVGC